MQPHMKACLLPNQTSNSTFGPRSNLQQVIALQVPKLVIRRGQQHKSRPYCSAFNVSGIPSGCRISAPKRVGGPNAAGTDDSSAANRHTHPMPCGGSGEDEPAAGTPSSQPV
jgi:hypothetical protein